MVIFFGPAGAGKSVQGQILAARHGWRWLSSGQLLRDTHDLEVLKRLSAGELVDTEQMNRIMGDALDRSEDKKGVILDGFPRQQSQAEWLVKTYSNKEPAIDLVIVLEVPKTVLLRRLHLRGRADDTLESVEKRMNIYRQQIYPILSYLTEQDIPIVHIDGTGTVGQIHDRIEAEVENVHSRKDS